MEQIASSVILNVHPGVERKWIERQFSRSPTDFGLDCTKQIVDNTSSINDKSSHISLQTVTDELSFIAKLNITNCKSEAHYMWLPAITEVCAYLSLYSQKSMITKETIVWQTDNNT